MKKCYHAYFGIKLGDQDKSFAPHSCCKACVENFEKVELGKDEQASVCCTNGMERGQRSHDRLLFLHDKLKRDILKEQTKTNLVLIYLFFVQVEML